MRQLVGTYKKHPTIRQAAIDIVNAANIPQKDYAGEVKALFDFVRDRIRYVRDIRGVETLATPVKTLEDATGDCDDKAVLLATLLTAIGHPTGFRAVGFKPNHLSHVLALTRIGSRWVPLETTEPVEMGWQPARVTKYLDIYN